MLACDNDNYNFKFRTLLTDSKEGKTFAVAMKTLTTCGSESQ